MFNRIANTLRPTSLYNCFMVLLALAMAMHLFALPTRSLVKMEAVGTKTLVPYMPDMRANIPNAQTYTYSFNLYYADTSREQTYYAITPPECVSRILINGNPITFMRFGWCDSRSASYWGPYSHPLYVELAPYLKIGRNTVEVETSKPEFDMGPVLLYGDKRLSKWLGMAMIVVVCCMLGVLVERYTGEPFSGMLLSCGFVVYMNRLSYLGVNQFSMDLPGHICYIAYVATHWALPNPNAGWSFYHAPLYYMLAGFILNIVATLRSFDGYACLQMFSVSCYLTLQVFSILTLRRLLRNPLAYYAAITLMIFYPSGILFAARLDSSLLFYACYSGCTYFLLRLVEDNTPQDTQRYAGLMLIFLGLSFASRANSLILLPLLAFAMMYRYDKWGWQSGMLRTWWLRSGLLVLCIGLALSIGRTEFYRLIQITNEPFLVGNLNILTHRLRMHNPSLGELFLPNLYYYFQQPFWNIWVDNGRQYFINSMMKSSLFGEYGWPNRSLAMVLNTLLLVIVIYVIDGYVIHRRHLKSCMPWQACFLALVIPIGCLMENRIMNSYSSSEDFRYIYPSMAAFCGMLGLIITQHVETWRPFRKGLGVALCVAFACCSVWFYLI